MQSLGAVWSFGLGDVWLSAESGRVLHFDGSSWTETQLDTYAMMLDIWAFGSSDVWMVGGNALAHYDGAGWEVRDLSEEHSGLSGLAGIWGTAPDDLWVVGEQSTVAHWDGSTWTRHIAAAAHGCVFPTRSQLGSLLIPSCVFLALARQCRLDRALTCEKRSVFLFQDRIYSLLISFGHSNYQC